jgi:predicted MFS family arabinose efflux permease
VQSGQFVTTRTEWRLVCLLIAAGYVAAFQVGKAAIALPLYRQDLGLSLAAASWVVGAYATLGAAAGLIAGAGVSLIGARRSAIGGLLVIALGSGLGALARGGTTLLLTRVVEGCGFIAVVIAAATLLRSATAPRHRDVVLTCWSTYMPGGSAVMMLIGPVLAAFGWPALWAVNAALAGLTAVALWAFLPRGLAEDSSRRNGAGADVASVMRAPGAVLLATAFGIYTFQYFALTGLLPTLLVERLGLSVAEAGGIAALVVLANAAGNVAAGAVLRAGIPLWIVVATGFAFLGGAVFVIFHPGMPAYAVAGLAAASLAVTGVIPATIFAATPRLAATPSLMAVTLGLVLQASNLGQLLGPSALGAVVQTWGWPAAPFLFLAIAVGGVAVAAALRRQLQHTRG